MADTDQNMILTAKLVDQVSDKLREINKNMLATEAAAKKAHEGGAKSADAHRQSIELLKKSFEQIKEASTELIKPGFAAMGVGAFSLAGAIGAVVEAVKGLGEQGLAFEKTARRSGLLYDKIRELQGIGQRWGVTLEQTNEGLANFGDFMAQSARHAPDAMRAWMQMPGLWQALGRELEKIQDPQKRIDAVLDFLPRVKYYDQRKRILQLLGLPENYMYLSAAELRKAREEEDKLIAAHGGGDEFKKRAQEADEAFTRMARLTSLLRDDMGVAFGPTVIQGMEKMSHFLEDKEKVEGFQRAMQAAAKQIKQEFEDIGAVIDGIKWILEFDKKFSNSVKGKLGVTEDPFGRMLNGKSPITDPAARTKNGTVVPFMVSPGARASKTAFEGFSQSDTDRYVEEPIYRAVYRALQDFSNSMRGGGGASSGFTNAAFHPGATGGIAGAFRNGGGYRVLNDNGGTGGGEVPAGSGPSGGRMGGNSREVAKIVRDEWSRAGMSDNGIAGLMANIKDESNFNPNLRHPDQPRWSGEAHFAHGLYQEGGAEWNRYSTWLQKNYPGADWRDPRMQSRFAAWNLRTNYPSVWRRMNSGSRYEAGAAYVDGYLKPAAAFRASRMNKYMRGGVAPLDAYTGPVQAPRQTDGKLLAQAGTTLSGKPVTGSANITVDFNNIPRGAKTAATYNGLFKEMKVNRGFQMPTASDSE